MGPPQSTAPKRAKGARMFLRTIIQVFSLDVVEAGASNMYWPLCKICLKPSVNIPVNSPQALRHKARAPAFEN